ncbi:MAG: hypothetical protein CM1200mP18_14660 [Gammaproteobacteria bacterium]|nr:MAG: hypothetical protein CM1200mP18_14660 [Gammaproteobacteria bacterium]
MHPLVRSDHSGGAVKGLIESTTPSVEGRSMLPEVIDLPLGNKIPKPGQVREPPPQPRPGSNFAGYESLETTAQRFMERSINSESLSPPDTG